MVGPNKVVSITDAQRDFSAGELDPSVKRRDDMPFTRTGARQLPNWRILNGGPVTNRPGRKARFVESAGRDEQVEMAPGVIFHLCFINNALTIRDANGASVASTATSWVPSNVNQINYDIAVRDGDTRDVVVCFPGMHTLIARYTLSTNAWNFVSFAFKTNADGSIAAPFAKLAPLSMTMASSALTGATVLTSSAAYFTAGMVGRTLRLFGFQVLLGANISPTQHNATVVQSLPATVQYNINIPAVARQVGTFFPGDIVLVPGKGDGEVVTATIIAGPQWQLVVNHFNNIVWAVADNIIGPNGSGAINALAVGAAVVATTIWDEAVVDDFRGWPQGVTYDQRRFLLYNLPGLRSGLLWSRLNAIDDFLIGAGLSGQNAPGAGPADPISEIVPRRRVPLYVVPGAEGAEVVFCDKAIFYIPINETNPLKPGSVAFDTLSDEGCGAVQPRAVQEVIVYANAGLNRIMSIVATGAFKRPYETRNLTELHGHLFGTVLAIAIPTADTSYPERYIYVLNTNGSIAVGKYAAAKGQIAGEVGWVPWTGNGTPTWIAALGATVLFTTTYPTGSVTIVETLDPTQYLDAGLTAASPPPGLVPGGGQGPMFWYPSSHVVAMDLGEKVLGTFAVDASGFVLALPGGTTAALTFGQSWVPKLERFLPDMQPGQDVNQRLRRRRDPRYVISVQDSTGFKFSNRTVPQYAPGENTALAPPKREKSYPIPTIGRAYDPRRVLEKPDPGPLTVVEISVEATV